MKLLAVHITTCLLAVSLLVAVVVGDEAASNEAASSESVSSDESIPASGSEEIDSQASGDPSGEAEIVEEASGESGSGVGSTEVSDDKVSEEQPAASDDEAAEAEDADDEEAEGETTAAAGHPPPKKQRISVAAMSQNERAEIVTIEIRRRDEESPMTLGCIQHMAEYESALFAEIARNTHVLPTSFVSVLVLPTPRLIDNNMVLQLSMFVRAEMGLVDGLALLSAVENIDPYVFPEDGEFELQSAYQGLPHDIEQSAVQSLPRRDIAQHGWRANMSLFVAIIGVAGACLIALTVGFLVVKARARRQQNDNLPMMKLEEGGSFPSYEMRSPFSDAEIKSSENVRP